jgi:colicin import membrane protein
LAPQLDRPASDESSVYKIAGTDKLTYNRGMRLIWIIFFVATPALGQELENEVKDLTWIGFQQFAEVSRVFVRTNTPARYHLKKESDGKIIMTIENTRIPLLNNRRLLDTRFFDSPILSIQPNAIEGPSPSVQIEITLRKPAEMTEAQQDTKISLDFAR